LVFGLDLALLTVIFHLPKYLRRWLVFLLQEFLDALDCFVDFLVGAFRGWLKVVLVTLAAISYMVGRETACDELSAAVMDEEVDIE
jgi:hypothetical protein